VLPRGAHPVLRFIQERLTEYRPVLRSARFGDPVLGLLKLADKLDMVVRATNNERTGRA
jgi:hypothetical protein